MGMPAAKQTDKIIAVDTHITMVPSGPTLVPVPLPYPFNGIIDAKVSSDVFVNSLPAATVGSKGTNTPPHIPMGASFQKPPSNIGEIIMGSVTVSINGKRAARAGDTAKTCNDPTDLPVGVVVAVSNVMIGG